MFNFEDMRKMLLENNKKFYTYNQKELEEDNELLGLISSKDEFQRKNIEKSK